MKTIIGNSRLIFDETSMKEFDFVASLVKVDSFIEQSQKLTRANGNSYIYFFASSLDEELFTSTSCWVGREVIGFSPLDLIEDLGLATKDFDRGEIHSFDGPESLNFHELFKLEQEIRDENPFDSTWRVKINVKNNSTFALQFWE